MATKQNIKKYQKMSKSERRVAIAKDVIKYLDAEFFKADSYYVNPKPTKTYQEANRAFHKSYEYLDSEHLNLLVETKEMPLKKALEKCVVCGKGSLFIAKILKFDGVGPFDFFHVEQADTKSGLSDAFTERMLDDIELAFECGIYSHNYSDQVMELSRNPSWNELTHDDRLRIICQNIIDNKGTFKPLECLEYEVV